MVVIRDVVLGMSWGSIRDLLLRFASWVVVHDVIL